MKITKKTTQQTLAVTSRTVTFDHEEWAALDEIMEHFEDCGAVGDEALNLIEMIRNADKTPEAKKAKAQPQKVKS